MLWVTIMERMRTSPMATGRQTLTNACRRRTRDRRPRASPTDPDGPAAEPHRASSPDAGAEEGTPAAQLEVCTELRELANRKHVLADDGGAWAEPDAVLDHDARRDNERSSPSSTPSPIWAPASRSAAAFSAAGRARKASWSSEPRKAGSRIPAASPSSNEAGSETPSVETPARIGPAAGSRCSRAAMTASTSFSVMNFACRSRRDRRCAAPRGRAPCASPVDPPQRALAPAPLSHRGREFPRPTRRRTRSSCRARPRRPPRRVGRSSRRPATRLQRSPSSSRRRRPAVRQSRRYGPRRHSATSAVGVRVLSG